MAEKDNKKNSGAGKFVVGALIGTLVGAVASRFVSVNVKKDDDFDDFDENDDCCCNECECNKCDKIEEAEQAETEAKPKAKTTKKSDK